LILGVSGQDGSYLAKSLLAKGYRVVGASRDAQMSSFANLKRFKFMTGWSWNPYP
jgi:GDPmannose 4,6-dehydratase